MVGYKNGATTYLDAVVSTVSGTTITPGTPATLQSAGPTYVSAAGLDSTHFVTAFQTGAGGAYSSAVVSSVSGTTITPGSVSNLGSESISVYESVAALDSTHFVVGYVNSFNARTVVSSVSGTTISAGSPVTFSTANVAQAQTSVVALDSTHYAMAYQDNATGYGKAAAGQSFPAASSNTLGMATNAASAGGTVTVVSNGIVTGLSGLTAGTTYYWNTTTGLTTSSSNNYVVGIALTTSSILLNSNATTKADQFFGDMVFANAFRITEAPGDPQGLIFKNQLGRQILSLDENGNLDLSGAFTGTLGVSALSSLLATSTTAATSTSTDTASSTPASWWSGSTFLSPLFDRITAWLADAANGVGDLFAKDLYATNVTADTGHFSKELCVGDVCVTPEQFKAMVAAAGLSGTSAGGAEDDTSTSTSSTSAAPTISVNGSNPATIAVGATYADLGATITGPTEADKNLGIHAFVNGIAMDVVLIDASTAGTHTIDYVATNASGTSTSTRTVIVEAPADSAAEDTSNTDTATTISDSATTTNQSDTTVTDTASTTLLDTQSDLTGQADATSSTQ